MNQQLMQEFEMKAQMKMQFAMIKSCFMDCVTNFRDDQLTSNEKSCLQNCARREIASFQTMAELQQTMMSRGGMGGGPQF